MFDILDDCIEMLENRRKPEVFISRQKCNLCGWYSSCHAEAESIKHLSLLPGVTASRYARLKALELTDLASLANANSDLLASYPEFVEGVAQDVVRQARSTLLNQPLLREEAERRNKEEGRREIEGRREEEKSATTDFVTDSSQQELGIKEAEASSEKAEVDRFTNLTEIALINSRSTAKIEPVNSTENRSTAPAKPAPILRSKPIPYSQSVFLPIAPIELYFDIEAEPDLNLDYLHGVLVVDRYKNTEKFYAFLAESAAEEGAAWQKFLELMWAYPIAPIFHFCDYEVKTFKRLAKLYETPTYLWKPVLKRFVDIHKYVTQKAVMPVESYALKPIARWLGFEWRDANANGAQCVCWYDEWLKTGDRSILEAIVRYNEDDCRATYVVKDWLTNFLLARK
ncbi:MAG: TM0106 family RecB-like putative nuclease [Oscillatoriales cyanobacterium RU_3_3]|nr:TM0106 family RecB-like putative nuclease [Oscillatoriales cyanobacterium RU_3_3]